ncbi:MAG: AAA family ATPase [Candidatus Nitrosopelagicus sp.]|nr:AAA family ATPase [Candidatus Nitrosopelagicus sp.]
MSNKERILIKNITIKNCGNFYGEHNIELSDSLDKNFTIIIGTSGMGKSTIFKLIYWCLFGSHYDPKTEVDSTDEGIINSTLLKNLGNGEKTSASVTLDIHDQDGEKYVLSRTLTATSHRETNSKKFDELNNSRINSGIQIISESKMRMTGEEGQQVNEKDTRLIKNAISKLFPENLSDFFLFDGEKLVQFRTKSEAAELIKDGIEKISGLPIVDNLIKNSKNTRDAIISHIADKDSDSSVLAKLLQDTKEEMEKINNTLNDKDVELTKKQLEYDGVVKKIQSNKTGKDIHSQIIVLDKTKKNLTTKITKTESKMKDFLFDNLPELLIRDTLEKSEEIFAKLEDEDKIPPSISRGAIDKILASDPLRCICGRDFQKDDGSWKKLDEIKQIIIDDDISQGITQGRGLISQILDRSMPKKINEIYLELVEDGRSSRQEKEKILSELDDLNDEIKSIEFEDDEDYGQQKKELWGDISLLTAVIAGWKEDLEDLEIERKAREFKLNTRIEHEKVDITERNKISIIKAVQKFASEKRSEIVDELRNKTEEATNRYFLESAPEKEIFDHVKISSKYDITACDADDYVKELSKGQSHVLGLSYVSGCRQITNTNTFLFIDSPLHNISGDSRNEISQVLSKNLPGVQVVLFVTDSEYLQGDERGAKPVRTYLNPTNKVWKEYQIVKTTANDGVKGKTVEEFKRDV